MQRKTAFSATVNEEIKDILKKGPKKKIHTVETGKILETGITKWLPDILNRTDEQDTRSFFSHFILYWHRNVNV